VSDLLLGEDSVMVRNGEHGGAETAAGYRQRVGRCPVCEQDAFTLLRRRPRAAERTAVIHHARWTHVLSHTPAELTQASPCAHLLELPRARRRILGQWLYRELRHDWGDRDRRGVHSIDEVLHLATLRLLWRDTRACDQPDCRHG
jgi:hypothetical protein